MTPAPSASPEDRAPAPSSLRSEPAEPAARPEAAAPAETAAPIELAARDEPVLRDQQRIRQNGPSAAGGGRGSDGVAIARMEPGPADPERGACTAPQLRRFIKSRAYVPMHELRRRFAINGGEDDVTPVDLQVGTRVFVGLPNREGRLLGELLRAGDIGYELSLDPVSPIVVGVFPMRPVPRA